MHFSEEDLRRALRRKDPGQAFTQRVMARINQKDASISAPHRMRNPLQRLGWRLAVRPTLAVVIAACLVLAASVGLLQYRHYREGEIARQKALLALRIANEKLNHVFERVKASHTNEIKVGRERL